MSIVHTIDALPRIVFVGSVREYRSTGTQTYTYTQKTTRKKRIIVNTLRVALINWVKSVKSQLNRPVANHLTRFEIRDS